MKRGGRKRRRNGSSEPVRFAVIGQGYFAQGAVLPGFKEADGCELRAIFSEDETKLRALKRKYGVAAALGYDQYDDYLRSGEVDAVYVALPNDKHAEYVIRAARAGVHVLCEKPIATNSADAERMLAACADNGVKLMIAYRLHFEGATLDAIERVRRGDIGRPRFFSSTFAMQVRGGNIRTRRARGGGPLLDLGIYCVNAARALFRAEPTEAFAMSASLRGDRRFREIDEQVTAMLRFPEIGSPSSRAASAPTITPRSRSSARRGASAWIRPTNTPAASPSTPRSPARSRSARPSRSATRSPPS